MFCVIFFLFRTTILPTVLRNREPQIRLPQINPRPPGQEKRLKTAQKNGPNEDKVKREAKSRIAAIRKQGKLRQQQSADSDNFIIINGTPNEPDLTLNNNLPLETSENGSLNSSVADDASLNSSLNSSLEGLCDSLSPESHQQSSTPSLLTREG